MSLIEFTEPAVLDELTEIVTEMLDGIVEASIPDGYIQPVAGYESQIAQATVVIQGADPCKLTIRLPASVCMGLASAMLDEAPEDLTVEDACAMLSELTNVLGGSVKSIVEEETSLGIPKASVAQSEDFAPLEDCVFVDHSLGVFQVRLGK
ncbi:MAG: chemotaxis protein CheX [Actinomycetota bacterium]